jgi:hypothetical protein
MVIHFDTVHKKFTYHHIGVTMEFWGQYSARKSTARPGFPKHQIGPHTNKIRRFGWVSDFLRVFDFLCNDCWDFLKKNLSLLRFVFEWVYRKWYKNPSKYGHFTANAREWIHTELAGNVDDVASSCSSAESLKHSRVRIHWLFREYMSQSGVCTVYTKRWHKKNP